MSANKIRIRPHLPSSSRIQVREKFTYSCNNCHNQYYDHYLFCPQCLGEVKPSQSRPSLLRVTLIPDHKSLELAALLSTLTGNRTFTFHKALESLPWIMIQNSEECILIHWKEVLEAEKAEVEIATATKTKRNWRSKQPVFLSNAPLPRFVSEATSAGVRQVARLLKNPAVRIKWVDAVLAGMRIVEDFYKRHPSDRLLFSEFLFNIDHNLLEVVKDFESLYKSHEEEMLPRIDSIQHQLDDMAREIADVRRRVEERL